MDACRNVDQHTQAPHLHEQVEDVQVQGEAGDDVVIQVMAADQLLSILQGTRQQSIAGFLLSGLSTLFNSFVMDAGRQEEHDRACNPPQMVHSKHFPAPGISRRDCSRR